jgi:glutamate-5-semialdehyde dehydrogenase
VNASGANKLADYCGAAARNARAASRRLATASATARNGALVKLAELLVADQNEILAANRLDVESAADLSAAMRDRLRLDSRRLAGMATAVREIAVAPDPVGQLMEGSTRPNGLEIRKVRVPLGVVFFIYESRPNVTTDAAALCLKSGNAVILRGGSEARHTNAALGVLIQRAAVSAGLPEAAVTLLDTTDRSAVDLLLSDSENINLVIPRGGEALIKRVVEQARMPVLKHYKGVCHVYLDESADAAMAAAIVENGKVQRPGVCNATECLLVHEKAAARLLPGIASPLQAKGVELRGCERTRAIVPHCKAAEESDYGCEFLDLILAVKVVDDLDAALVHISRYGTGHTEAIVTKDYAAAQRFLAEVDAAAVAVNASTRFNDGGELGLGAEIGISTDKFHARGPCGLAELTSYKYQILGSGQIRS